MSKAAMISKASRAFNKVGFTLKKRSPEILAVAGTVGVITSGVMACKATTKVSKIIEERNEQLEQVNDYVDENGFTAEYTEDDNRKDIAIIHTQTGFKMVKLYAPAVTIGVLSLAALLGSNQILRKRNVALGAAYTALDRSFKKYRNAVIDRFGEELDKELKYGLKAEKVENEIRGFVCYRERKRACNRKRYSAIALSSSVKRLLRYIYSVYVARDVFFFHCFCDMLRVVAFTATDVGYHAALRNKSDSNITDFTAEPVIISEREKTCSCRYHFAVVTVTFF